MIFYLKKFLRKDRLLKEEVIKSIISLDISVDVSMTNKKDVTQSKDSAELKAMYEQAKSQKTDKNNKQNVQVSASKKISLNDHDELLEA